MPSSQLWVGAVERREEFRDDGLGGKTLFVNTASGDEGEGEAEENWAKAKEEDENDTQGQDTCCSPSGAEVAQQVRRAAALTAELAAQSENVSVVCDQPPGFSSSSLCTLGRLTWRQVAHTPGNKEGGGKCRARSHEPPVRPLFLDPELSCSTQRLLKPKGASCRAQSRSLAGVQEAAARVEERVGFYVKATGKDETQTRLRLAEMTSDEVRQSR